jgi:hypothetical protein
MRRRDFIELIGGLAGIDPSKIKGPGVYYPESQDGK